MRYVFPVLLVALVLFGSFWAGIWWWSALQVEEQFLQWQAQQAAEGRVLDYTDMKVVGFPSHLRLKIDEPSMLDATGWRWNGADLTAEAPLWQPRQLHLTFPGTHTFQPPENSPLAPLELAAATAEGQLWLDRRGRLEGLRLDLRRLALAGYFNGGTKAESLLIGWGNAVEEGAATVADSDSDLVPFVLAIDELELPSAAEPPLGRSLQQLRARGNLDGLLEFGPPETVLPSWAERGGQVQLDEVQLTWGPLRLEGDGNLTLDQERRPLGAGHARIFGFEETVNALAEADLVKQDVAGLARLALLAMSSENSQGRRQIEVPITAQNGILRVGPLPLLPLPRLF
jgi:hypothetical protein